MYQDLKEQDMICSSSLLKDSTISIQLSQIIGNDNIQKNHLIQILKSQTASNNKTQKKPVYIISSNFRQKHINNLVQLFQQNKIPLQFQNQTNSLGINLYENNQHYFVVVDNKLGNLNLGEQFKLSKITVVGYPKKTSHKNYQYFDTPETLLTQYEKFIKDKGYDDNQNKILADKKQNKQELNSSTGSSFFNNKLIKVKSISKYDSRKLQEKQKYKKNTNQSNNIKKYQNINSNFQILKHNLFFVSCSNNQQYIQQINKLYYSTKFYENKQKNQQIILFRNEKELLQKVEQISKLQLSQQKRKQAQKDYNSKKQQNNNNKLHFIVMNSQHNFRIIDSIMQLNINLRQKFRIIIVLSQNQLNKNISAIKKCFTHQVIHAVVKSRQQCKQILQNVSFKIKSEQIIKNKKKYSKSIKSMKKVTYRDLLQSKIQSKYQCHDLNVKEKDQIYTFKQENKEISSKQLALNLSIDNHQKIKNSQKNIKNRDQQKSNNIEQLKNKQVIQSKKQLAPQQHQIKIESKRLIDSNNNSNNSSARQSKKKFIIPSISSLMSTGKIQSPSPSKILTPNKKLIIVNKSKSKLNSQQKFNDTRKKKKQNEQNKKISDINAQYCLKENENIIQKIQQKIQKKRNSSKLSNPSSDKLNQLKQNFIYTPRVKMSRSKKLIQFPIKKVDQEQQIKKQIEHNNQNSIKNIQINNQNLQKFQQIQDQYQINSHKNNIPKRRIKLNLSQNQKFFERCSQIQIDSIISNKSQQMIYKTNFINGFIYIEYNQLIRLVIQNLKQSCPHQLLPVQKYRKFYLARQYQRQLIRLFKNQEKSNLIPILLDIQGLNQIYNHYMDLNGSRSSSFLKYKKMNKSSQQNLKLIFFLIITENDIQNQIFYQIGQLKQKISNFHLVRFIIEQNLQDNQLKAKSDQIFWEIQNILIQQCKKQNQRLLGTF